MRYDPRTKCRIISPIIKNNQFQRKDYPPLNIKGGGRNYRIVNEEISDFYVLKGQKKSN
jgi:hypothetical protein